jgi:hypothetical protein
MIDFRTSEIFIVFDYKIGRIRFANRMRTIYEPNEPDFIDCLGLILY